MNNTITIPVTVSLSQRTIPVNVERKVVTRNVMAVSRVGTTLALTDPNLVPGNIRRGVTIWGVTGTYEGE